ncbi:Non-histone protein 10 [Halotydeus destructor]|nr:Non-histone protein 10 [Halotydeus destructor]
METEADNDASVASCSEQSFDLNSVKDDAEDIHKLKFEKLNQRCEEIQMDNEKLINHIYQLKRIVNRYKRQKKTLASKLDSLGDKYKEVKLELPVELKTEPKKEVDVKPTKVAKNSSASVPGASNSSKQTKKPKDSSKDSKSNPNAPKKPINPYLLFCQENRSVLQDKHTKANGSEMSNQELTKALAQHWHDLSATDKQVFYNLYEHEKERYERQMKAFNETQKELQLQLATNVTIKKEPT